MSKTATLNSGAVGNRIFPPADMDFSWQRWSACRGADLRDFFQPEPGEADYPLNGNHIALGKATSARYARAKAVCATCPVSPECLEQAMTMPEQAGIWGGTTPDERAQLRRDRKNERRRAERRRSA